jgi:DNA-binding GntR family transcriptional regulator
MIVRGRLPPGEILGEAALCEALGISRTPLREALKHLASEGLVELRPNRSSRVTPIRTGELGELFEAVGGIERIAAELAAARATALELRRLRALHARMERHHGAAALDEYFHLNQQIHRLIVEMAKNSVLRATHDWLLARVERARFLALASRARWDESVQEHRDILTALEAGDGERAGRLLSDHVRRTGQVVAEALADQTASDSGDAIPVQPAPAAR